MHELSLMNDLMRKIQAVARENDSPRVVGVKVALGALSHISAGHFREHFVEAARGTVAEGATLEIAIGSDISDPRAQDVIIESVEVARA